MARVRIWLRRGLLVFCLAQAAFFAAILVFPGAPDTTVGALARIAAQRRSLWEGLAMHWITFLILPLFVLAAWFGRGALARGLLLVSGLATAGAFVLMLSELDRIFAEGSDLSHAWVTLSVTRWATALCAFLALAALRLAHRAERLG